MISLSPLDVSWRGLVNGMDKKLVKNLVLSIGYNLLTVIVPFITAPYLGRILGAEKVGTYTYVHSIASYFVMFGLLGMRSYGNRTIARVRDSREERSRAFWEIYTMQFITGFLAFLLYVGFVFLFIDNYHLVSMAVGMYVMTAFLGVDWLCDGMEDFATIAKRTLFIKTLNMLLIFLLIRSENDLVKYCVIMSSGYLLSALLIWPTVKKHIDFIRPKFSSLIPHFKSNVLLFVPTIAASIYQTMDKIMIGGLASEAELAYYEYAEKITQIPMLLFTAMGAVMLSRMSHIFKKDEGGAFDTLAYSMDLSFAIGSAFCFGLAAIANELVLVYYGTAFSSSGPILMALTPMIILYGWANVIRMQYVIPNNLNYIYITSTIAGAVVNLIFNLIFIPRYKAVGATIGTLAAQFTVALVFTICVKKKLPLRQYAKRETPLLVIGLLMGIVVYYVSRLHPISLKWLIVDVLVGGVVFGTLYFWYGWKSKNNLASKLVSLIKEKTKG